MKNSKIIDHLDKLHAFKVIVDSASLREASTKLHVTQPALTRLIQTLELAASTPLLSRGRQGVLPTEAGKKLHTYAHQILSQLNDLEEKLKNPLDQLAGHLTIGTYESLAQYLWPQFLPELKKKYPQIKISLRTMQSFSQLDALQSGQVDLIVDAEPRSFENVRSWVLYQDRFQIYGTQKIVNHAKSNSPTDLPLIFCPAAYDENNKTILQHMTEAGLTFKETIQLDSFPSVLAFCRRGLGLGVLPQRLAAEALDTGQIYSLNLKGFNSRGFGIHSLVATALHARKDDGKILVLLKALREWHKEK